jgi:hypothetical protein
MDDGISPQSKEIGGKRRTKVEKFTYQQHHGGRAIDYVCDVRGRPVRQRPEMLTGGAQMNVDNVSRDDWILAGIALLLAIDLLFLPWFDITVSAGAFSVSATSTATGSPDGWLGILAVLAAVALVVDIAIERLSPQTQVPAIGGSRTSTRFILAAAAAGFVALKFLFHIHFSIFGFGFWLAVVLAAALVVLAARARQSAPVVVGTRAGPGAPPAGPAV